MCEDSGSEDRLNCREDRSERLRGYNTGLMFTDCPQCSSPPFFFLAQRWSGHCHDYKLCACGFHCKVLRVCYHGQLDLADNGHFIQVPQQLRYGFGCQDCSCSCSLWEVRVVQGSGQNGWLKADDRCQVASHLSNASQSQAFELYLFSP